MKRKKQIKPFQLYAIRVLQISGISLITVGLLNLLLVESTGWLINVMLLLCGFCQLWISYRLWFLLHSHIFAAGAKFTTPSVSKRRGPPVSKKCLNAFR